MEITKHARRVISECDWGGNLGIFENLLWQLNFCNVLQPDKVESFCADRLIIGERYLMSGHRIMTVMVSGICEKDGKIVGVTISVRSSPALSIDKKFIKILQEVSRITKLEIPRPVNSGYYKVYQWDVLF